MPESRRSSDLIQRTYGFAKAVRAFADSLPRTTANGEDVRQLIRASGSVAANYLEAQEGLSRKDFFYRIKICRKEARESGLWLHLVNVGANTALNAERERLVAESKELRAIFATIVLRDHTSG